MPYLYVELTHGRTALLASDLSLHVAMQLGPYLHPVSTRGVRRMVSEDSDQPFSRLAVIHRLRDLRDLDQAGMG